MVMTSEYITKRTDDETRDGVKRVYFHNAQFDAGLIGSQWTLSGITESEEKDEQKEETMRIVGHGITKKLYERCVAEKMKAVVLCQYTEDGDNTAESVAYLRNVWQVIDALNDCDAKIGDIKKWKL